MSETMRHTRSLLVLLVLLTGTSPAEGQTADRRAPETDQTVPVSRGARLTIDNFAGEVVIRTEARDSVRVAARHSSRNRVDIQTTAAGVVIRARGSAGPAAVDYEVTAPNWMPIKVSGTYTFVSIEGAQSEVSAETVRGDIVVKGGTGFVTAKSIEGEVIVEGARGKVNVSSVNEGVRITGASGDIVAETTNGDIALTQIESQSVDVTTVNGDILYEGSIMAGGRYRLGTHNGDVTLGVPETANATFSVRTYSGDFSNNLGLKAVGEVRRGRRTTYVLGSGAAEVELESFNGTVRIRRAGTLPAPKSRGGEHAHAHGTDQIDDHGFVVPLLATYSPVAASAR
ncbi:MAG TPA: DUF4097 family beta strand repeat-containing protein [Vicinamibacterales bacterium]|nr:DUF4097 family beta strand repeat-containing protein [Vicinamibacterales bacterium]